MQAGRVHILPKDQDVADVNEWDIEGRIVLPGLADMHVHLDKTYSDFTNVPGTLRGAIESFRKTVETRTEQDIHDRAERALKTAISAGVTRMRSHINLGGVTDLTLLRIMSSLRDRYQGAIELQLTGMASIDLLANNIDVVEAAQRQGMNLLGGCPALESKPESAAVRFVSAAADLQLPLDLHVDETEDPLSRTLEHLAEAVTGSGFQLPVTAGHCCSLGFMRPETRRAVLSKVESAGITIVTLPMCNLVLMGRDIEPKPRGVAPSRDILDHGITLCAGSDNVHDPFNPFGNYDPLLAMQLTVLTGQLTDHATLGSAFDLVTRAADAHFTSGGPVAEGEDANLVVLDETDLLAAIVNPPPRLAVFNAGRLVYQRQVSETWDL